MKWPLFPLCGSVTRRFPRKYRCSRAEKYRSNPPIKSLLGPGRDSRDRWRLGLVRFAGMLRGSVASLRRGPGQNLDLAPTRWAGESWEQPRCHHRRSQNRRSPGNGGPIPSSPRTADRRRTVLTRWLNGGRRYPGVLVAGVPGLGAGMRACTARQRGGRAQVPVWVVGGSTAGSGSALGGRRYPCAVLRGVPA